WKHDPEGSVSYKELRIRPCARALPKKGIWAPPAPGFRHDPRHAGCADQIGLGPDPKRRRAAGLMGICYSRRLPRPEDDMDTLTYWNGTWHEGNPAILGPRDHAFWLGS